MSIVIQWIIVGLCVTGAAVYLLHRLGLFAWLGWIKPRGAGSRCSCSHCPALTVAEAMLTSTDRANQDSR